MSLAILFHFLCVQHVSDINMSIIRILRLFCWITTLVVLLEFRCGWVGVVSVLQACCASACNTDTTPTQPHRNSNTHRTKNNTTNVVIQHNSRKLLMMDILMSETCWAHKKWNNIASDIKLVFYYSTITMIHGPINIKLKFLYSFRKNNPVFTILSSMKTVHTLNFQAASGVTLVWRGSPTAKRVLWGPHHISTYLRPNIRNPIT